MASSLRLISSKLVTSSFRPTLVSASCFLSINRSYSSMPTDGTNDQSSVRILCPKISSLCIDMTIKRDGTPSLGLKIPEEDLTVDMELPRLRLEDMKACADHNTLFLQSKLLKELKDGIPNNDEKIMNIIANDILQTFRHITDMFSDRSILGKGLCQVIAASSPINSFSIHKCMGNWNKMEISMSMPGRQRMMLTKQGLSVSLKMCSHLKREDTKVFFEYDTFFIEGKTKKEHYITGIHLPEGIQKKSNLIKRKMKDGIFYATLPCCVKKEELPLIKDQLKLL